MCKILKFPIPKESDLMITSHLQTNIVGIFNRGGTITIPTESPMYQQIKLKLLNYKNTERKEAAVISINEMLKSLKVTHTPIPIGIAGEIHVSHGQLKLSDIDD